MKKLQMMIVGVLGVAASGMTMAAPIPVGAGGATLTLVGCPQLASETRIVLSANVVGAVDCDDGTFIGISACHASGQTSSREVSVAPTPPVAPSTTPTCTAPLALQAVGQTQRCVGLGSGAAVPTATTGQGTVISRYPGAICSASAVAGESTAAVAELE